MDRLAHIQTLLLRSRRWPWLVVALTLAILGGTILLARQQLRERIRAQIAGRDGEVLHAVTLMQLHEDAADLGLAEGIHDPGTQLKALLKTSRLKGVLGVRLYDPAGRFVEAFPFHVVEAALLPADLRALKQLHPVSHFRDAVALAEVFWPETTDAAMASAAVPLLEVNVPLHDYQGGALAGVAQFILEGQGIAHEFAQLDRHLNAQALAAFAGGGLIVTLAMAWAFGRWRRAQAALEIRTRDLLQANQELAFAARTSALGAVSAHLIHGLRNPLSGLHNLVTSQGATDGEWREAIASTRRMQAMIAEVVNLLRDEQADAPYEVSLAELEEILRARWEPLARTGGVELLLARRGEGILSSRTVNLLTLILTNLVENAVQATPAGQRVQITLARDLDALEVEVRDEGPGLPEEARAQLFMPCRSTRREGSGIGLAICKQLAHHLGAALELRGSSAAGCVFALTLPLAAAPRIEPRPVAEPAAR